MRQSDLLYFGMVEPLDEEPVSMGGVGRESIVSDRHSSHVVHHTSRDAYKEMENVDGLHDLIVLFVDTFGAMSNKEILRKLRNNYPKNDGEPDWEICTVTARVNELLELGRLVSVGTTVDPLTKREVRLVDTI